MKKALILFAVLVVVLLFASCDSNPSGSGSGSSKPSELSNTWNLRSNARFEVEVYNGVYWVPANILGKTRYTNDEITGFLNDTPEEKASKISNLYEALQLFELSKFTYYNDNKNEMADELNWEHSKPGYAAVASNQGNFSPSTNWLLYILAGDYDEIGAYDLIMSNGDHRVYNYIHHGGYYYFFDIYCYEDDSRNSAVESGELQDYYSKGVAVGNIHKTKTPQLYAQYCLDRVTLPIALIVMYPEHEVVSRAVVNSGNNVKVVLNNEIEQSMTVLYDNPDDNLTYEFAKDNSSVPSWSGSSSGSNQTEEPAPEVEIDPERDTWNLRSNASFELEVTDGLWWVPANALGQTHYTNEQIAEIVNDTPQEKKAKISNLYEAIQLFQISGFADGNDNIRVSADNINWEHHKPGYYAITTNNGCCATDSNWLLYVLDGDYDEVGMICYSYPDGGGHVFNYIKEGEYYYFIDLTHYRNDFRYSAAESGKENDYFSSDFVAGNIHKTKDPLTYVQYCLKKYNNPPALFAMYPNHEVVSIDGVHTEDGIIITYNKEIEDSMTIVYDNPDDNLTYGFAKDNSVVPDWSQSPSVPFEIVTEYDVVTLQWGIHSIQPNSGFGCGRGNVIHVSVMLNGKATKDYTFQYTESIGPITRDDDGKLNLYVNNIGDSEVKITVKGKTYSFYWHCGD